MSSRLTLPVFLFLSLVLGLTACKDEPCGGIDCGTGVCVEGFCECDSLYEGFNCEILTTEKFKGVWTSGDICGMSSSVYTSEVTDGGSIGQIVISPFGPDRLPVIAQVGGSDLTIPEQAYGLAVIRGTGGMADSVDVITLDYLVDYGGGSTTTCLTSLEKQ